MNVLFHGYYLYFLFMQKSSVDKRYSTFSLHRYMQQILDYRSIQVQILHVAFLGLRWPDAPKIVQVRKKADGFTTVTTP